MVRYLNIDIETYSDAPLPKVGVYTYAADPSFKVLLFAYTFDGDKDSVEVIDLENGESLPLKVREALTDPSVKKVAFNANFERVCLSEHLGVYLPPEEWQCSMAMSLRAGYPASLGNAAEALKVDSEHLKDKKGNDLIRLFSVRNTARQARTRGGFQTPPSYDPEAWKDYIEYNRQDVIAEIAVAEKLEAILPKNETEERLWHLDQRINDRGILIDEPFIDQVKRFNEEENTKLFTSMQARTGLPNPKSNAQFRDFINRELDTNLSSVAKGVRSSLIAEGVPEHIEDLLHDFGDLTLSSVSKYEAMERSAHPEDHRVRGTLQYHGANTGRWAGRLIQPQNLSKHSSKKFKEARQLIKDGNFKKYDETFTETRKDMLSQLVRTAIIATPGNRFVVSDFSAIEARVIAWFAKEEWRLQVFQTHGKIYEASASEMFNVPIEEIGNPSDLRAKGKVAELALGYQGGPVALLSMGAAGETLKEYPHLSAQDVADYHKTKRHKKKHSETDRDVIQRLQAEMQDLVDKWRSANGRITNFWYSSQEAAVQAVENPRSTVKLYGGLLEFRYQNKHLYIRLPSGRYLVYPDMQVKPKTIKTRNGEMEVQSLSYAGYVNRGWHRIDTYGGKLVENIVQATARDCLVHSMFKLEEAGYRTVFHVHDEVVLEAPKGYGSLKEVTDIMAEPIPWAPGLPLGAAGFEDDMYYSD